MTARLPPISESAFQDHQVIPLARMCGFVVYHTHDSRRSEPGFPDLVLVRPPRFILAELKRQDGKLTGPQRRWQTLLAACPGVETHVWRPADLDQIAVTLRRQT